MITYKYLVDLSIDELNSKVVIPCLNEDGFRTLLIKSTDHKRQTSSYSTKHLIIKKNVVLTHDSEDYFLHLISCRESTEYINHNFDLIYDYMFKKIENGINENEFSDLLLSIEELFSKATENIENLQVGTAGELLTLLYFHKFGHTEIIENYHKNAYSKHDIELDENKKIEVKTTTKESRIHKFSHRQLVSGENQVYISSVLLSKVEKGMSLYQLFHKLIDVVTSYETLFSLRKMMNYCNVDITSQGVVFDYNISLGSVRIISANDVPHITTEIPNGISNLYYDSNCDFVRSLNPAEIFD
jgi:hypothetical protein